uniref:Transmembrane protein n=1 Tax=Meloidogyne incognita TaxID=6306 RepID=A0A914KIE3_MELIC
MPWRFQDSSWLNFVPWRFQVLFLAKFYAVAVSRLFLAKFYAVEVEHQLNNISNSATLTNFFNSTASTQPTSTQQHQLNQPTQQHQLNQPTQQHQLNQLQLNSINSTNFNSTASTQQHQLNQLLQLSNIFIQQQLQLNNKNYRAILKTMQTLEPDRKCSLHFVDVFLPLSWSSFWLRRFGTCVVLVLFYIIFQKVQHKFKCELLRVVLGLDYFLGFPFSGVEGSVPYQDGNTTTSHLGLYSKLMAILEIDRQVLKRTSWLR